jgi:hypothetical protein
MAGEWLQNSGLCSAFMQSLWAMTDLYRAISAVTRYFNICCLIPRTASYSIQRVLETYCILDPQGSMSRCIEYSVQQVPSLLHSYYSKQLNSWPLILFNNLKMVEILTVEANVTLLHMTQHTERQACSPFSTSFVARHENLYANLQETIYMKFWFSKSQDPSKYPLSFHHWGIFQ